MTCKGSLVTDQDGSKADRMEEERKYALRYVLYRAMLDIRPLAWFRLNFIQRLNPVYWKRELRRIRRAGAIADWMHNLALFSALDFERFDEARFWRELDKLNKRNPEYDFLTYYKGIFDRQLAELQQKNSTE